MLDLLLENNIRGEGRNKIRQLWSFMLFSVMLCIFRNKYRKEKGKWLLSGYMRERPSSLIFGRGFSGNRRPICS